MVAKTMAKYMTNTSSLFHVLFCFSQKSGNLFTHLFIFCFCVANEERPLDLFSITRAHRYREFVDIQAKIHIFDPILDIGK